MSTGDARQARERLAIMACDQAPPRRSPTSCCKPEVAPSPGRWSLTCPTSAPACSTRSPGCRSEKVTVLLMGPIRFPARRASRQTEPAWLAAA